MMVALWGDCHSESGRQITSATVWAAGWAKGGSRVLGLLDKRAGRESERLVLGGEAGEDFSHAHMPSGLAYVGHLMNCCSGLHWLPVALFLQEDVYDSNSFFGSGVPGFYKIVGW